MNTTRLSHHLSWQAAFGGIVACIVTAVVAQAEDMRTIEGQVFIRTKGGDNIKLSLVDILLFDGKVLAENLQAKRLVAEPIHDALQPQVKAAKKKWDETKQAVDRAASSAARNLAREASGKAYHEYLQLSGKADYAHSTFFYFNNLPAPSQGTKTDAEGKFSFKVPSGSYVLVAASSRTVGIDAGGTVVPEKEPYYWMVRVNADADKRVMLANDNLSTSGSADSLVETPDGEGYISDAMKGDGIAAIATLVEKKKRELAFAKVATAAQQKAIELYPDVGVADSPLNKEFVERVKRYQTENKEFFAEPDWPVRLAKECSEELVAKPVPK